MSANTIFLRLEGPLQAWGNNESKFVIRRTCDAPTKSGVIGLICAAMGVSRAEAPKEWLPRLSGLRMSVRIDSPGIRWWDYHTVGAKLKMRRADEGVKDGAMLTRREFLCDASFLVVLQGEPALIKEVHEALLAPKWTLYLGRKCCPPSRPLLEHPPAEFPDHLSALTSLPWRPRLKGDNLPESVDSLLDWLPNEKEPEAPMDAEIWYDVPLTFQPPSHAPRFVIRKTLTVGDDGEVRRSEDPFQKYTRNPPRTRANYTNTVYRRVREERLNMDERLCVFCKSPATTVQHVTYRNAGGDERTDELRSLCRLCHDAVTMIEYGMGMGMDRIDPVEERWRDKILEKRREIVEFRSLETRRRRLEAKEVE